MEVSHDFWIVIFIMGFKVVAKINFLRKFHEIFFRNAHPSIMEIATHEDAIYLVSVQFINLLPYELITELNDIKRM